jgi:DNA-directed RNA polymerase beta subunit
MITIRVAQGVDEQGLPEEFTSDIDLVAWPEGTDHLDENGLPIVGTVLKQGMIMVGKWGRSADYDRALIPRSVDYQYHTAAELKAKFGYLFVNSARYVKRGEEGCVASACFEGSEPQLVAVVQIEGEPDVPRNACKVPKEA